MANYDFKEVMEKYYNIIASVSNAEGVDMGIALDMLINMVNNPENNQYKGIIEDYDYEEFKADILNIIGR